MTTHNESAEQVGSKSYDTEEKINWLAGWGALEFTADRNNPVEIKAEQDSIRWYARGYLVEYNEEHQTNHIFEKFEFIEAGESPLKYTVTAFLIPPAVEEEHNTTGGPHGGRGPMGGTHLVPHPPPNPGGRG